MLRGVEIKDTRDQNIILKICRSEMCLQRVFDIKSHFSIFKKGLEILWVTEKPLGLPHSKIEAGET